LVVNESSKSSIRLVAKGLKKVLYGLKQVPRAWYITNDRYLGEEQFVWGHFGPNIYIKTENHNVVILLIYVDDIIIIGSEEGANAKVKSKLCLSFGITNLSLLHYCLGVEV
jgi:hypothetical protein